MRISLVHLKKLEVQTKSGVILGKVQDLILETEGQNILQYEVGKLVGKKYLVSREEVLNINEEKMIVEDTVVGESKKEEKEKEKVVAEPEPFGVAQDKVTMMSE